MKNYLISFVIVLIGFMYYSRPEMDNLEVGYSSVDEEIDEINYERMKVLDSGYIFLDIFLNNLMVGIVLSLFGFLSGGLVTVMLLFYNGYLLAPIYNMAFELMDISDIFYYSKHIPLELAGLFMLSAIGFKGLSFYKYVFFQKRIIVNKIPKLKDFLLPVILLFIASIIETL